MVRSIRMKAKFKYEKICCDVTKKIQKGAFQDNRLPSIRSLAKTYRVSLLTAYKAVKILESQGLIRCQPDGKSTVILTDMQTGEFQEDDPRGYLHAAHWSVRKTRVKIRYLCPEYKTHLKDTWAEIFEDFARRYPWIEVVPVNIVFSNPDNMKQMCGDVVQILGSDLRYYHEYGWATCLDELVKNDRSVEPTLYWPPAIDGCRINGKLYALPQSIEMPLIYYKPELLKAEQLALIRDKWTWKDFRDIAETLKSKAQGVALNVGLLTLLSYFDYESLWRRHFGRNSFMLREALELLRWIVRQLPKRTKLYNIYELSNVVQHFAEDKIGMFLGYMPFIPVLMQKCREGWDIARPPQEKQGKPVFETVLNIIDTRSAYRNESWLFLKHIASREVVGRLSAGKNSIPAILDSNNNKTWLTGPPDSIHIVHDLLSESQPFGFTSRLSQIIYQTALYPCLTEWLTSSRPDDAIWDDICHRCNKLFEVYN